jgi:PPK2 family polyphosphate:nucleotide phosphotransferase
MKMREKFVVRPGKKAKLTKHDPDNTGGFKSKASAQTTLEKNIARLADLQYLLFAENKRAMLIVLQAMDSGGKDGTIRHVMSGLNPQSCRVTAFKGPSAEELAHDFLWRIHKAVPRKGEIGIFNRSHYEDVLVVRVHKLVPKSVWSDRYHQINVFEKLLTENGVTILKFFLHISKKEQRKRFQERLQDSNKNWKIAPEDFEDRAYWDDYVDAYEDALTKCSTPWAPWYVIPADNKWFRNLAVSQIIVETMEELDMKFPKPEFDLSKILIR